MILYSVMGTIEILEVTKMYNHKQEFQTKLEKYMDAKTWCLFISATVLLIEAIFFQFYPMGYSDDIVAKAKNVILISGMLYCVLIAIIVKRHKNS